jgi:hypothetical protein
VALPDLRLNNPDQILSRFTPVPTPDSAGGGGLVVNSLRGSYGGVLMVGVLTSLVGMVLINVWSIAAGVLLGVFTFWEDCKAGKERARAEAKVAVAKLMDEVIFQVGDELRTQLRRVHRELRDHFTAINDGRLRAASDAVRSAADGGRQDPRLIELEANLAELRPLRMRLSGPPRPPARPAEPPPAPVGPARPAGPPPAPVAPAPASAEAARGGRREPSPASRG